MISASMSTKCIPLVVQKNKSKRELENSLFIAPARKYFCSISETKKLITIKRKKNSKTRVLNAHAPVKKKIQRFNNNSFTRKKLRRAIMHHCRLKNVFNKNYTPKTWDSYKKQRNFCVTF